MMVYMVHLTNQMAMKAPVPNIQEILRQNPDIARQMATEAMKTQTQQFRQAAPQAPPQYQPPAPAPAPANPLSGLMSFLGAAQPPPPPATNIPPQVQTKKITMPSRPMPPPQMPSFLKPVANPPPQTFVSKPAGMAGILQGIQAEKPLKSALKKTPTSTATRSPKNSVVIKL